MEPGEAIRSAQPIEVHYTTIHTGNSKALHKNLGKTTRTTEGRGRGDEDASGVVRLLQKVGEVVTLKSVWNGKKMGTSVVCSSTQMFLSPPSDTGVVFLTSKSRTQ